MFSRLRSALSITRLRHKAEEATEKAWNGTKDSLKETAQAGQAATRRAAAQAQRATQEALQKTTASAKEYATQQRAQLQQTAARKVETAQQSLSNAATRSVEASKQAAQTAYNESVGQLTTAASDVKLSISRSFWWWSLAAIGVLGLSMSIPREIRLALEERTKRKNKFQEEEE